MSRWKSRHSVDYYGGSCTRDGSLSSYFDILLFLRYLRGQERHRPRLRSGRLRDLVSELSGDNGNVENPAAWLLLVVVFRSKGLLCGGWNQHQQCIHTVSAFPRYLEVVWRDTRRIRDVYD